MSEQTVTESVKRKTPKAFRLSDDAELLITLLEKRLGVNQRAVVELALRDKAKAEGIVLPSEQKEVNA